MIQDSNAGFVMQSFLASVTLNPTCRPALGVGHGAMAAFGIVRGLCDDQRFVSDPAGPLTTVSANCIVPISVPYCSYPLGRAQEEATGVLEVPVGRHGSSDAPPGSDRGFVNAAPVFPDQDFFTEGDQSAWTIREVPENTVAGRSIGAPVSARDEDDDLLIYTLSGPDAEFFRIGRNDGQLKTEAPLNYEARSSYSVMVTATDPFGATDSIQVDINVTDEDDPAEITVITARP